jgi:hypothetical protein
LSLSSKKYGFGIRDLEKNLSRIQGSKRPGSATLKKILARKFYIRILICNDYFSLRKTFMKNGEDPDPDPYLLLTDPDPEHYQK